MKRFVFDGICILLIVMLGRTYLNDPSNEGFEEKLARFNAQVENHEIIETPTVHQPLNPIEENWAGRFGEAVSGMVVNVIDGSVRFITSVFSENSR